MAPGRAHSVCARRSPQAAGDNAAVRSLRTSVSSTSVTVIAPGAGWSITSTATVSTTGATGCFTFRTAFLTERRDEQDKPKLPRVECLNGSIAAITIQRLKLRGEICGHVATLPNTMPSNHAAKRRTRTTSTWAVGNSVTAAIEFSAPRSIPLDEVTRLRDASLSFAVTHNHFAAPPA